MYTHTKFDVTAKSQLELLPVPARHYFSYLIHTQTQFSFSINKLHCPCVNKMLKHLLLFK